MGREREDYRPILEDLLRYTNGARTITINQAAAYLGCCPKTVKRKYGAGAGGINVITLALKLASMPAVRG